MNTAGMMVHIRKYGLVLILVWTCILAGFLWFIINQYRENTIKEATREARDYHELNLQYRRWSAKLGGVYTPTDKVAPNPHLIVPDRDVITDLGKSLTLVNPAYMTRMVFEAIRKDSKNPIVSRLVSLKPLNPVNTPNAWERETLQLFEKEKVRERSQVLTITEQPYLQFMAAVITEESCLKCHAHQGYKVGDVRGGMSIAFPMSGYLAIEAERRNSLFGSFALLWALGVAGITVSSRRRHLQEMMIVEKSVGLEQEIIERQKIQDQLEEHALELEEQITERQLIQERLEEQAAMLEEETAERLQAVVALQKSEHFLQSIIDSEPECVKLLDVDCNLLLMNRAGLEMIDAESFEQIKGQSVCPLVCEPYRDAFAELTRRVFQGIPGNLEFEVIGLKGRRVWMNSIAVPFRDENDTIVAALAITRNVTELKQTVQELQKKNAEIEQFIYTVSHDLRSPLVTVKTFMGYLETDIAGDNQGKLAQDIQFIHGAADKMKLLLDELMELSRIGRVETPPVRVSLKELVAEVLDVLAGVIKDRKVDVHVPDSELMLFGDRPRLCQIWQNLIENAVKYSRDDNIPRIEFGVQQVSGETAFFVRDNGIGIDPQYHSKIFGIFEKLNPKSDGAGMGLTIIQRIVQKCGGKVWVESEGSGKGSCFFFTLPHAVLEA